MPPEILPSGPLVALDFVGIAVFAISGALVAAEKKQTPLTFVFFAVITGVGGGTLRDLLIGAPVFWVKHNATLLVCLAASMSVWFFAKASTVPKALLWFDALGLAAYSVYGTEKALRYGIAPVPACAMGVMTTCVGGIVRDLLAQQPSILMRPEVYVTAAIASASLYGALAHFGVAPLPAAAIAGAIGFSLRALAIVRGLSLPSYKG